MRSKPILLTILFSVFILSLSMINIDLYKVLPFKASYYSLTKDVQKQVTCLAENIYFEAAHEPYAGKKAVAFVTINRVQSGNYANNICDVVFQKTGGVCQFSWYCEDKPYRISTEKRLTSTPNSLYNDIRELAVSVYINYERMIDPSNGALFYHADYVNPGWKNMRTTAVVGRHIFYTRTGKGI